MRPSPRSAARTTTRALAVAVLLGAMATSATAHSRDYQRSVDIAFPTDPRADFVDDYDVPRGDDDAHRATDLFASTGTPVFAARGGRVTWAGHHPSAGWALHVRGDDGRRYAYYHLGPDDGSRATAFADGITEGATVSRGQHIGYVGDSGNAVGGPAHLHFEIHDDAVADPYGGSRINPVASLRDALARGDHHGSQAGVAALRLGDHGPHVLAWQRELNAYRAEPIREDGAYGYGTLAATTALQEAEGIEGDGVVGPRTRAASAAALAGSPAGPPLLREGDTGRRVAEWQQQLDAALPMAVTVDGIFGPRTDQATRELQQRHGGVVDGVVGREARQLMHHALR